MSEKYGFMEGTTEYRDRVVGLSTTKTDRWNLCEGPVVQTETSSALPASEYYRRHEHLFLLAEIHSLNENYPHWAKRIGVYLRPNGQRLRGRRNRAGVRSFHRLISLATGSSLRRAVMQCALVITG